MGGSYSKSLDETLHPPPGYVVPKFPSLYNPRRDFHNKIPVQYLFYASGIFQIAAVWFLITSVIAQSRLPVRHLSVHTVLDAHILRRNVWLVWCLGRSHCRICITPKEAASRNGRPSYVTILDIWNFGCSCWRRRHRYSACWFETSCSDSWCLLIRICTCCGLLRGIVYHVNV